MGINAVPNGAPGASADTATASTAGSLAAISIFQNVSARTADAGATSIKGLQSVVNTLSARTLALRSAVFDASTVGSIAALSQAMCAVVSQFGQGQVKVVTGAQAVVSTFPQLVSGLSISIVANGIYDVQGALIWTVSAAGASASCTFNFGISINQAPAEAAFRCMGNDREAAGASIAPSIPIMFAGTGALCATPSIMYSARPSITTSGDPAKVMMFFDGLVVCGAGGAGKMKVVVGASTTSNTGINVLAGSYIKAFKIG